MKWQMFRNEGMDKNQPGVYVHGMLTWLRNMESVMDVTEQVVSQAALKANGSMIIEYQGKTFDLTPPWKKVDMTEAVAEITGVDF